MVVAITLIIRRKHNKVRKITCLNDQRSNNSEQRNLTEQDLVDGETGESWPRPETRYVVKWLDGYLECIIDNRTEATNQGMAKWAKDIRPCSYLCSS